VAARDLEASQRRTDRAFGAVSALLAILFLVFAVPSISDEWRTGAEAHYFTVGPRLFPYVAGSLVLLCALLIALRPEGGNQLGAFRDRVARRNVLAGLGVAIGYVALLVPAGFTVSSLLAITAFCLIFGERRWYVVLPLAAVVAFGTPWVFLEFFYLELPAGPWTRFD